MGDLRYTVRNWPRRRFVQPNL